MASDAAPRFASNRFLHCILAGYALGFIGTAVAPRDWPTWVLESEGNRALTAGALKQAGFPRRMTPLRPPLSGECR